MEGSSHTMVVKSLPSFQELLRATKPTFSHNRSHKSFPQRWNSISVLTISDEGSFYTGKSSGMKTELSTPSLTTPGSYILSGVPLGYLISSGNNAKRPQGLELKPSNRKEKHFHCDYAHCSSGFSRRSDLNKHVRLVHKKIKPFRCDHCPSSFGQKGDLRKHRDTHFRSKKPQSIAQGGYTV